MILGTQLLNSEWVRAESPASTSEMAAVIQTDSDRLKEELEFLQEETVSIAVSHEQPISEAPSNVYVVTAEDIRHSGAKDLPTILRRIPGIEVTQLTGSDFNVSARGDNQLRHNKMLVMVDGRSIYLDAQGEVLWRMIPVTLPEIKRIEVLKGPASVLYGFNAFDGIINIITKSPEEMKGATLQFGGGGFGSITAAAIGAGTAKVLGKDLGFRLSYARDQNNKWSDGDSISFLSNKFNIQTNYAVTPETKLVVSGGLVDSTDYDGPIVETGVVDQNPAMGYANVGYEGPSYFIRGWWQHLAQPFSLFNHPLLQGVVPFAAVPIENRMDGNSYNLDAQHALEFGAIHRFTYGVNYRHNTFTNNRFNGNGRENRLGFYIQEEWKATQTLTVTAGLRFDLQTFINPTYSPRIALVYRLAPDHSLRLSGTLGYRPPTITETRSLSRGAFTIPGVGQVNTVVLGNKNLAPEQIMSYEFGYQGWFYKHRLKVRMDAFYNHISDLIDIQPVNATTSTFNNGGAFTAGQGEADIYGGEAGFEVLFTPWLSGLANYSYQEIEQTFRGQIARGGPRFKWNAGLRAEFENGLSGEVLYHYYGATKYAINSAFPLFLGTSSPGPRIGSYNLLNLRGAYRFRIEPLGGREAEVAVSVFNALNDKHKEHPLGETIKNLVMGWLTITY
ncbi:MAG: TonB-dependent receptor plug domain-containing protein [Nitrospirales bacterium]